MKIFSSGISCPYFVRLMRQVLVIRARFIVRRQAQVVSYIRPSDKIKKSS